MRCCEILFDWSISEISRLADSDIAEAYANQLTEPEQDVFTTLTEQLRGIGQDLQQAKTEQKLFPSWRNLREISTEFHNKFPTFPESKFDQLFLTTLLAEKINDAENQSDFESNTIEENLFEIRTLTNHFDFGWFARQNNAIFENSIVVFSFQDKNALTEEVINSTLSPKLGYQFLAALRYLQSNLGYFALIKKMQLSLEDEAINAFVRLSVLASGKCIHTPETYVIPLHILDADLLRVEDQYQQWNEVHIVLSEYNGRTETLLKYLTIYHVIENFMFKLPIVELERKNGGKMFSIRDFRRLYSSIDTSEMTALKRLFDAVLKENAKSLVTFNKHLTTRWKNLISGSQKIDEMNSTLALLGIKQKYIEFTHTNCAEILTKIVYQIRCAIVHNKETEFHLTHTSFNNSFKVLIEGFLLPSLEEISYFLIGRNNPHVWYAHKELQLYS